MEIIKIAAIGVITAFCAIALRETKSEAAIAVVITGSILIFLSVVDYFTSAITAIKEIVDKAGIPPSVLSSVLKVIAIAYIADFAAGVVEDCGYKSVGDKIVLAGKIIILSLSIPIVVSLFNLIGGLL